MTKKVLFTLLFSTTFLLLGFYFLTPTAEDHLQKALGHMKEGEIFLAENILDDIERKHPSFPLTLYRGYVAQAKGLYRAADHYFQKAMTHSEEKDYGNIFIAQLSNAYFEGKERDIPLLFDLARTYSHSYFSMNFFEGLDAYLMGNYPGALKCWGHLDEDECQPSFSWEDVMVSHLFSSTWRNLHIAHCLLEEGDIALARELCEKEVHFLNDDHQELQSLGTLILGLTYLKEGELVPPNDRESFYKIAHFYFERGYVSDFYGKEKKRVLSHIEKKSKQLINAKDHEKWALAFTHLLQDWKADSSLQAIVDVIVNRLVREPNEESLNLCSLIASDFNSQKLHTLISEQSVLALGNSIQKGEVENLFALWNCVEAISLHPKETASYIATLTADEIFQTLCKDDSALSKTTTYLSFWQHLEKDEGKYFYLTRTLLSNAQLLWQKEGCERKGTHLMQIALELAPEKHKGLLLKEAESFLTRLYCQAEECNMVARLSLIYDAFTDLGLILQDLTPPYKLANYLADAEYLFAIRNYSSAQVHAEWVLKIDPNNEQALRLFGLSSYHLGDYEKAFSSLKQLSQMDEYIRKALVLSKVFFPEEETLVSSNEITIE